MPDNNRLNVAKLVVTDIIVFISAMLLVALFLLQRFGTEKVSFLFSPIMVIWLLMTPLVGVYNIIIHYPKILKAVS
eukprot:c41745_g1_i1 orf=2-226(-)